MRAFLLACLPAIVVTTPRLLFRYCRARRHRESRSQQQEGRRGRCLQHGTLLTPRPHPPGSA